MNKNEYTADYRNSTEEVITTSGPMQHRIAIFPEQQTTKTSKKGIQITLAVICLLLALVTIALISLNHTGQFNISAACVEEDKTFADFVAPLVMFDPEPFDNPNNSNKDILLAASVWKATTSKPLSNSDSDSNATISKELVVNSYQELFGSIPEDLFSNDHTSDFFKYDKNSENFIILPYSNQSCYIPYIDSIDKNDESTNLTVWYVSPNDPWRSLRDDKPDKPEPTKKMIYTLKQNNGSLSITSVHSV